MENVLLNTSKMANRVGYEKIGMRVNVPTLLNWNFPNLVEIEHTQNKLKTFIEKPLENKN